MLVALLLLPLDVGFRRVHLSREQIEQARDWVRSRLRRRVPLALNAEAAASLAGLKEARSRVRLNDAPVEITAAAPAPVIEITQRTGAADNGAQVSKVSKPPQPADAAARPSATAPAQDTPLASRLLDARKKRRE
jgi:hypothetical protein